MINEFIKKIDNIKLPEKWIKENIQNPNDISKRIAKNVLLILSSYFLLPDKIEAGIEGGIILHYKHLENELHIEIYNDGQAQAVVLKNKQVKKTFNIYDSEYKEIVKEFNT